VVANCYMIEAAFADCSNLQDRTRIALGFQYTQAGANYCVVI